LSPEDEEAIRDDTGNWSDEEIPRPLRADTLQAVPAAIRREVRKAHNGLGHPSKTTFLRMTHLANATEAAKRYAKAWECPVCARRVAPRKPQVATGETRPFGFNKTVCVDLKYLETTDRKRLVASSMIDAGTGLHATVFVKTRRTDHVARKLFVTWVAHYGVPDKVICDQGGEFMKHFSDMCESLGIDCKVTGAHAGWQNALIERHGAILEQLWNSTLIEHSGSGGTSMRFFELALAAATNAKNSTLQRYGYTPEQSVYGRALKWPTLLTDGEEVKLAALDADPEGEYTRAVLMRNTARMALLSRDSSAKIKRAVLRRTRPDRPERLLAGMRVYFWSPHPLKGRNRQDPHRWRGPATIVSPDGDSRYFVSWRGRVLLTARDQLRLATGEESAAAAAIGEDALLTKQTVHEDEDKRGIDVSEHQPVPEVPERPEAAGV